jgi:hypothetical protein
MKRQSFILTRTLTEVFLARFVLSPTSIDNYPQFPVRQKEKKEITGFYQTLSFSTDTGWHF